MHCVVLATFAPERERKRTTAQADSQGHVSHYHELMSRVWPANAFFLRWYILRRNDASTRFTS